MNNLLGRETSGDVLDRLQIPTVLRVKSKVLSLEHMAHKIWSLHAPPISFHCLPPSPPLTTVWQVLRNCSLSALDTMSLMWELHYSQLWTKSSLVAQMVKRLSAMQKTQVQSLSWEDPLEEGMATHSSILAWKIPWTGEPSRLQSMGS